jgi:hypothetical protein
VIVAAILSPVSTLWVSFVFARNFIHRLPLGLLLNAADLMSPITLVGLQPIVNGLQLRRVQPVQPVLAALYDGHNADLAQHAEMLGYRRLRDPYPRNDVADGPFLTIIEKADDLSPPRLPDCVEDIGSGCCSRHALIIFPYGNICQEKRRFSFDVLPPIFARAPGIDSLGRTKTQMTWPGVPSVPGAIPSTLARLGSFLKILRSLERRAEGDPRKIADVILQLANSDEVPVRLILGVDAEKRVQQAEAARVSEAEKWLHLTVSTVFEDAESIPELLNH